MDAGSGSRPADVLADLVFELCGDGHRPTVEPIKTIVEDWYELAVVWYARMILK